MEKNNESFCTQQTKNLKKDRKKATMDEISLEEINIGKITIYSLQKNFIELTQ